MIQFASRMSRPSGRVLALRVASGRDRVVALAWQRTLTNLGYDGRIAENAVAEGKRAVGVASFEKLLKAALQELSAPKGRAANSA